MIKRYIRILFILSLYEEGREEIREKKCNGDDVWEKHVYILHFTLDNQKGNK